jgi:hypothetical protein
MAETLSYSQLKRYEYLDLLLANRKNFSTIEPSSVYANILKISEESLAPKLHEAWRTQYIKNERARGIENPVRIKPTHEQAGDTVDIANTPFSDLPEHWKNENRAAARKILLWTTGQLKNSRNELNEEFMEDGAKAICYAWNERNVAEEHQVGSWEDISEEERNKDRIQVVLAVEELVFQTGRG